MSDKYRILKNILASDLFDGRLENFGISEFYQQNTSESTRLLTDGRNYLEVRVADDGLVSGLVGDYVGCLVGSLTRYLSSDAPGKILNAISVVFDVAIVSEWEPGYWGFDTMEEWEAAAFAWQYLNS